MSRSMVATVRRLAIGRRPQSRVRRRETLIRVDHQNTGQKAIERLVAAERVLCQLGTDPQLRNHMYRNREQFAGIERFDQIESGAWALQDQLIVQLDQE